MLALFTAIMIAASNFSALPVIGAEAPTKKTEQAATATDHPSTATDLLPLLSRLAPISFTGYGGIHYREVDGAWGLYSSDTIPAEKFTRLGYENIYWSTTDDGELTIMGSMNLYAEQRNTFGLSFYGKKLTVSANETLRVEAASDTGTTGGIRFYQVATVKLHDSSAIWSFDLFMTDALSIIGGDAVTATITLDSPNSSHSVLGAIRGSGTLNMSQKVYMDITQDAFNAEIDLNLSGDAHINAENNYYLRFVNVTMSENSKITSTSLGGYNDFSGIYIRDLTMTDNAYIYANAYRESLYFNDNPGYSGQTITMSGNAKLVGESTFGNGVYCSVSLNFTGGTPEVIGIGENFAGYLPTVSGVDLIGASVDRNTAPSVLQPYSNVNSGSGGITKENSRYYLYDYPALYLILKGNKVPPVISTTGITHGIKGEAYTQAITTSGGTTPITWSLPAAPSWMSINASTGEISGTPTADGATTVTVRATNADGYDEKTYTLNIYAKPEVTTISLPNGTLNQAYSTTIAGTGTAPVTWSIVSGALPAGLTFDAGTQAISGTPTAAGSFSITVQGANAYGTASRALSLFIAQPPAITTESLPAGITGTAYSVAITGTGNPTPEYLVESGTFPPGLSLSTTGAITGTPTAAGTYAFSVKSQNGYGTVSKGFTITIGDAPGITTETLPDATINKPYSAVIIGTGTAPVTYSIISGTLPTGLTFDASTKTISGTPTAAGSFSITMQAASSYGTATKALNLFVGTPPSITTNGLPDGITAEAYSQSLVAAGTAPITWSIVSGSLPAGLSLSTSGVISGTPTADCTSQPVTIKAANAYGEATKELTVTVRTKVSIVTTAIPTAPAGKEYEFKLEATGTQPYMWSVVSGNFPAGLKLAGDGTIYGTPLAEDSYTVTLKAANLISEATREYSIKILGVVPEITTETLPASVVDEAYSAQLQASGTLPHSWSIKSGVLPEGLSLSSTGLISGIPQSTGAFDLVLEVDNGHGKDQKALCLVVARRVEIITESLKHGISGATYLQFIDANGTTPMTWAIESGELPPGITISDTMGFLLGTPAKAGTYTFVVKAVNAVSEDMKEYTMVVGDKPVIVPEDPDNPSSSVNVDSEGNLLATLYEQFDYTIVRQGSGDFSWNILYGELPEGLSLNPATGAINGVPAVVGKYSMVLQAETDYGSATSTVTIRVLEKVDITQKTLPAAEVGKSYIKFIETKGTTPIVWTITAGELPEGLALDKDTGIITGIPVKAQIAEITVNARNAVSQDNKALILKTGSAPKLEGIDPDEDGVYRIQLYAVVNEAYEKLLGILGEQPLESVLTDGELPEGLSLDSATGKISGTPVRVSKSEAVMAVSNDFGHAEVALGITVMERVRIRTEALKTTGLGMEYYQVLKASGGEPIKWSTESALPKGLALDGEKGVISGASEQLGSFDIVMKAENTASEDVRAYTLAVKNRLTIGGGDNPPEGEKDKEYHHELEADTDEDEKWSLIEGEMPPGLELNPDTGEITGTPTESGEWTVNVGVETENGYGEKEITIIVKDKDGDGSGGSDGDGGNSGGSGGSGNSNKSKPNKTDKTETIDPAAVDDWLDGDTVPIEGAHIYIDDAAHDGMRAKLYPSQGLAYARIDGNAVSREAANAERYITAYIPSEQAERLTVEIPLGMIVNAGRNIPLTLQFGDKIGYQFTAPAFATSQILNQLGAANASDVTMLFTLKASVDEATHRLVENAVIDNGYQQTASTTAFTVTAAYNGRFAEIKEFERYISRIVPMEEGSARATTTAVAVEADGTLRHVPTDIFKTGNRSYLPPQLQVGDGWYGKINSRSNSVYTFIAASQSFTDARSRWYKTVVDEMAERRIIFGIGNDLFAGDRSVSRAEFTAIVIRALGLSEQHTDDTFTDINPTDWYYAAVTTAKSYGIAQGYTDGSFAPNANITRQEAMAIAERASAIAELNGTHKSIDGYKDSNLVADWAAESVCYNVGSSLIVGENTADGQYLKPLREITRAESAAVVLRVLREAELVDVRE